MERKRKRHYQNKLNKVKQQYLEDECKRKTVEEIAERNLQDLKVFEDFCHDVTKLPPYYYYESLRLRSGKRSIETIIKTIVDFLDDEKDKKIRKRIEAAMDKYIEMYFPNGCNGYNEALDGIVQKAEKINEMNFTILENILKHISDDDSWKLVAKHLNSKATDASIEAQKTPLDKKCYVFINLVPKQIALNDLCPALIFALSEYCECKVDTKSVEEVLEKAVVDQDAEYFD